jgi:hypothetical protein
LDEKSKLDAETGTSCGSDLLVGEPGADPGDR